jgi:cyclase
VRELADIRKLLLAGADKVSLNTAAVDNPELIRRASMSFGSQCIVVAIDAKQIALGKWEVYTHGGRTPTAKDALQWAQEAEELGAGEILLTSMDCDGTKDGFALELTRTISEKVRIPVIASGGAGKLEHFYDTFTKGKADAALAASIFHYKEFSIRQVKKYLQERGITVRL